MQKSYNNVSEIRQWLQGTTITSCSPILSALYGDFVPAFEHGLEDYNNDNKEGCKGQRKKKIMKRAA